MTTLVNTDRELGEEPRDHSRLLNVLRPFLNRFLALNHDINNSLGGVIGYAECLLLEEDLSASQRECAEKIMICAEGIQALMEELGDLKTAMSDDKDLEVFLTGLSRSTVPQTS
ncbi:MAG: hypothetical protein KAU36_08625 [candidate division Zixibacteria bacterium]|nr:hypothetical protein [candidate division Zixibacteria bacterium]